MSALELYRDDGPFVARLRNVRSASPRTLGWIAVPLVRALEYGFLIVLTTTADPEALPECFAFLVVLVFHHYDTVYRLQTQGSPPAGWVRAAGGGWEGRIVLASVLGLMGVLGPGLLAAAVVLASVYVTESAASWIRFPRGQRPSTRRDADFNGLE